LIKAYKLFLCLWLLHSAVQAQPSFFEKVFGDSADDCNAKGLVQLASGKVIVATNNFNLSGNTIKLFGFDSTGNPVDTISVIAINRQQTVNRMIMADGFLYLTGFEYNSFSNSFAFLIKSDTAGNFLWNKFYGDSVSNYSFQGIAVQGNSVFCSGYISNPSGTGNSMYIMKLDTAGNFIWNYIYAYPFNSVSDAVIPFEDGNIIASGDKLVGTVYTNFLVKLDSSGNFIWDYDLPNPYNNGCKNDFLSASGDIYIVGESSSASSFYFDATVTRIDTAHNLQWSYTYSGWPAATDAAMDMIEPLPGHFLITGYGVNPADSSADIFLMRIDSTGTEIDRTYIGANTFDIGYSIIKANSNAGCYIAGSTDRNGHNQNYLVYTGLLGIQPSVKDYKGIENNFSISPNPCSDFVTVKSNASGFQHLSISLADVTGKYLISDKMFTGKIINLSVENIASGIYFISVNDGSNVYNQKIIIQH
jgi:hypothetical protein